MEHFYSQWNPNHKCNIYLDLSEHSLCDIAAVNYWLRANGPPAHHFVCRLCLGSGPAIYLSANAGFLPAIPQRLLQFLCDWQPHLLTAALRWRTPAGSTRKLPFERRRKVGRIGAWWICCWPKKWHVGNRRDCSVVRGARSRSSKPSTSSTSRCGRRSGNP